MNNDSMQFEAAVARLEEIVRAMEQGDLPLEQIIETTQKAGYEGFYSLEWLKRWRPELRDPDVIFYHFQTYMETLLAEIENEERM